MPEESETQADASIRIRIVRCPNCSGDSIYAPSNPYRPFCSARCKGLDFGAWAGESFRLAADSEPDELKPPDQLLQ
ncbi:MAG: DNA gyrase inhibitor YacG [Rhodoferax sp.]|nr:DNA gyrase inhibitor YacG [Rhodoferax sp.]MBP9928176.1 DNA gyrase inhibitor YacG [Rhodoferax sp.]HQX59034.1 DNA gyrase inhibitor YacG [Burkholderiaceae bacterium]HQZ04868.1 DNA gyrase inhibitor YacG [Burkholderiaceae bacterium]HRA62449.1 DNA gyrase inhibitor YacG [Burkholderiaceae bacterium]